MSTARNAPNPAAAAAAKLFTELKVSAHLMTFDVGLFCIVQTPGARRPDDGSGLPGVRISLPPAAARPDAVRFANFREDGWLSGQTDAMLVRVLAGPAQILVTIYQAPTGADTAPRLQVLRLSDDPNANAAAAGAATANMGVPANLPAPPAAVRAAGPQPEIIAHAQIRGDIGANFGEWIGDRGSKRWIEGFMLNPRGPVKAADIEYQAVLGRGWLSPWVGGGQFCGSRGMALPLLGLRVRLRGRAAQEFDCHYWASFVDGTQIGPVSAGEACESDSLVAIEAIKVSLTRKGQAVEKQPAAAEPVGAAPEPVRAAPAAKSVVKPAAAKPGPAKPTQVHAKGDKTEGKTGAKTARGRAAR
jgi:hypothetical protein